VKLKEQVTESDEARAKGRCLPFAARFFLVFLGAVVVVAFALSLLRDTKDYVEDRRIPVMLPTGGAKF